ncbi:hypothetical protein BDV36DRAFT_302513 [Aspergillus pseudocaelatus]|uniref:NAD(P)-binding domain-containing protein n=1 Tax=Aspergillus pseudocaelatus TaxID=1825620 RepID=A0ABQ6W0M4_9EURO|nr:hypothetical protein BDV36DRAFT_302513 [Aspergillus pseudocaelatus]
MSLVKVLYTGATGYIGGSVLTTLLTTSHEAIKGRLEITAVVRKPEQAQLLESKGVKGVVFNGLEDSEQMHSLAKEHDMVIHTASTVHTETIARMIDGLAARRDATGRKVYFIHTAGTGSLADRPISRAVQEDRVFSDKSDNIYEYLKKRQELEDLPVRRSDVTIVERGRALNVPTFILMSPLIYGTGTGYFNQRSIQIPYMVRAALKVRHAEMVADGAARWGNIHIEELASLYEVLIARILRGDPIASGEKGIYFTVSGEHAWRDIIHGIAREGHSLGAFEDTKVKQISLEEAGNKWMGGSTAFAELVFCSNARTKSDLAREYGWTPKYGDDHVQTTIVEEINCALA